MPSSLNWSDNGSPTTKRFLHIVCCLLCERNMAL